MRLFLIRVGDGKNHYILASCPADAKKQFLAQGLVDCEELSVFMTVAVINYLKEDN